MAGVVGSRGQGPHGTAPAGSHPLALPLLAPDTGSHVGSPRKLWKYKPRDLKEGCGAARYFPSYTSR